MLIFGGVRYVAEKNDHISQPKGEFGKSSSSKGCQTWGWEYVTVSRRVSSGGPFEKHLEMLM